MVGTSGSGTHLTPCLDCAAVGWHLTRDEAARPCMELPGSGEKVRAMAARYQHGLPLYHDGDNSQRTPREVDQYGIPDDACGLTQPVGGHPR